MRSIPAETLLFIAEYLDVQTQYSLLKAYPILAHGFTFHHTSKADIVGNTIIHLLALRGEDKILEMMLRQSTTERDTETSLPLPNVPNSRKKGVNINLVNRSMFVPLHQAASRGYVGVVKVLLSQPDIVPDWRSSDHTTPLGSAIKGGYEEVVEVFLEHENVGADIACAGKLMPLSLAAKHGRESIVRMLLERHDISAESKIQALVMAASRGYDGIVKLLLDQEDVDIFTTQNPVDGWSPLTPLHQAACNGHLTTARLLIDRNPATINARVSGAHWSELSPLALAAFHGQTPIVQMLLKQPNVEVNGPASSSPLLLAVQRSNTKIVQLLLERPDVILEPKRTSARHDIETQADLSPLVIAVTEGVTEVVKLFLERPDVDVNITDKYGNTLLDIAVRRNQEGVVRLLLQRSDLALDEEGHLVGEPLKAAILGGNAEVVRLLLEHPNVDIWKIKQTPYGSTPLSVAAGFGSEAVVALLLERADTQTLNGGKEQSPGLISAAERGYGGVVNLFLARDDIDVNAKNLRGYTALQSAIFSRKFNIVKTLIQRADIDVNLEAGEPLFPPLTHAIHNGFQGDCAAIVQLLLEYPGVDLEKTGMKRRTPLAEAAKEGHEEVVSLLLQRGVNINAADIQGATPLILAARKGNTDVVKLLLEQEDIKADWASLEGISALSYAAYRGFNDIVYLLLQRDDVSVTLESRYHFTPIDYAVMDCPGAEDKGETLELFLRDERVMKFLKETHGQDSVAEAIRKGIDAFQALLLNRENGKLKSNGEICHRPFGNCWHGYDRVDSWSVLYEDEGNDISVDMY